MSHYEPRTVGTSHTPAFPLTEATHVLYVQEQADAGNWSASGNFAITVDTSNCPPGVSALFVPADFLISGRAFHDK